MAAAPTEGLDYLVAKSSLALHSDTTRDIGNKTRTVGLSIFVLGLLFIIPYYLIYVIEENNTFSSLSSRQDILDSITAWMDHVSTVLVSKDIIAEEVTSDSAARDVVTQELTAIEHDLVRLNEQIAVYSKALTAVISSKIHMLTLSMDMLKVVNSIDTDPLSDEFVVLGRYTISHALLELVRVANVQHSRTKRGISMENKAAKRSTKKANELAAARNAKAEEVNLEAREDAAADGENILTRTETIQKLEDELQEMIRAEKAQEREEKKRMRESNKEKTNDIRFATLDAKLFRQMDIDENLAMETKMHEMLPVLLDRLTIEGSMLDLRGAASVIHSHLGTYLVYETAAALEKGVQSLDALLLINDIIMSITGLVEQFSGPIMTLPLDRIKTYTKRMARLYLTEKPQKLFYQLDIDNEYIETSFADTQSWMTSYMTNMSQLVRHSEKARRLTGEAKDKKIYLKSTPKKYVFNDIDDENYEEHSRFIPYPEATTMRTTTDSSGAHVLEVNNLFFPSNKDETHHALVSDSMVGLSAVTATLVHTATTAVETGIASALGTFLSLITAIEGYKFITSLLRYRNYGVVPDYRAIVAGIAVLSYGYALVATRALSTDILSSSTSVDKERALSTRIYDPNIVSGPHHDKTAKTFKTTPYLKKLFSVDDYAEGGSAEYMGRNIDLLNQVISRIDVFNNSGSGSVHSEQFAANNASRSKITAIILFVVVVAIMAYTIRMFSGAIGDGRVGDVLPVAPHVSLLGALLASGGLITIVLIAANIHKQDYIPL